MTTVYRERPSVIDHGVVWSVTSDPAGGRVLPDGCMDLLWLDDELVIAGPDTQAYVSASATARPVVGIRLSGGVGPEALGVPAPEVRNARVPAADLWGAGTARTSRRRLEIASDRGRELERIVGERLEDGTDDPHMRAVDAMARKGRSVPTIASAVGLSERQLRRRTHAAFGYGVKTLVRIHRFQQALARIRAGVPAADAAVHTGYADQPHLAREVRALAGAPLSDLLT